MNVKTATDLFRIPTASAPRKRPSWEEHRIQCTCVQWFRYQYPQYAPLLFAVPNGGQRNAITAAKLKAEGVVPGVADLLLLIPNHQFHGLCIEIKTRKGRQSDKQKAWQAIIQKTGYQYQVTRNFEEFKQLIEEYLQTT